MNTAPGNAVAVAVKVAVVPEQIVLSAAVISEATAFALTVNVIFVLVAFIQLFAFTAST
ncbi:hypothetical protein D3C78_1599970 [compost metagenome]